MNINRHDKGLYSGDYKGVKFNINACYDWRGILKTWKAEIYFLDDTKFLFKESYKKIKELVTQEIDENLK